MRRSLLMVAVMIAAVLVGAAAAAYAQRPVTSESVTSENHSWDGYHWARTANPLTLNVGDNVGLNWDAHLVEAIDDWHQSTVLDLTKVDGGTRSKPCRPTAGRIEVCAARYGKNGWLGLAQIWISDSHITQATAKVNDTYFTTARYNTPAWRQMVMCHEVGHDFGLAHQDEDFDNVNLGSCLDYTADPDGPPSNEHPDAHDYEQLETIYNGHTDGATTVGHSTASGVPSGDLNTPRGWGRSVFRTADGRAELFERDLGHGARGERQRMFTWVRWTEEEAQRRANNSAGPRGGSTTPDSPVSEETTSSRGGSTMADSPVPKETTGSKGGATTPTP